MQKHETDVTNSASAAAAAAAADRDAVSRGLSISI